SKGRGLTIVECPGVRRLAGVPDVEAGYRAGWRPARSAPWMLYCRALARGGKDAGRTMRRTIATHGLLLVVSAIWGGHFVALHFLLQELAPPEVMLIRAILASGFYAVFLLLNRRALPAIQRADWSRLITTGFLGIAVMGLGMGYAQRFISAGVSSLIVTLNPIFTALLAYLLLGQALTRRQAGGVALALGGFFVVLLL